MGGPATITLSAELPCAETGAIPLFDGKPSGTSEFFDIRGFSGQIGGNWYHEKEAFPARIRKFELQHKQVFRKGRLNARS
jgi:hypothetical protein